MTYPAPKFLSDDPWFGPAPLSTKAKAAKVEAEKVVVKETIHEVVYKMATKTKLTCYRDQPWVSGAGR